MALSIYLLFTVSWFLHLPARFPFLGTIRFDFLLVLTLLAMAVFAARRQRVAATEGALPAEGALPTKILWLLVIYILVTIPLVQWPGSVVRAGFPNFLKAVVFFLFTWQFVRTEKHLKIFLAVFVACQLFRVLEPLLLHLTEGYWGSRASMRGWTSMVRLSGAPSDVVNPNGLAFICLTVLPFLYYYTRLGKLNRLLLPLLFPPILYAMVLTGSRSGLVALFALLLAVTVQSRQKALLALLIFGGVVVGFQQLGADLQDRYLSLFDESARNAATVEGRIEGFKNDMNVALRRPLFGHGLGTSLEANFNFRGRTHLAHNLFAEIAQELGFLGLGIFLFYIAALLRKVRALGRLPSSESPFLEQTTKALIAWFYMNLVFCLASYGLSSYEWYLFPALILKVYAFKSAGVPQEVSIPSSMEPDAALSGMRP